MHFSFIFVLGLLPLALSVPAATTSAVSPYMTNFPICGVLGNFNTHYLGLDSASTPANPAECLADCLANSSCKAVSFGDLFPLCFFLSDYLNSDEFQQTDVSSFYYYDDACLNSNAASTTMSTAYPTTTSSVTHHVSGYPVCGVSASFSAINGPAPIIGVHQGDPLVYCMGLCGDNPSCKAVSFISWSSTCTLYSKELRFIDLIEDTESEFEFYDYVCGESSTSNKRSTTTEVTVPADTTSDSPKIAYATGYPLCEIAGYSYQEPILDYVGSTTRSGCLQGCRVNATCRAVAYKDEYDSSCYFYRRHVEYDQVWEDKNSLWCFYDEVCEM